MKTRCFLFYMPISVVSFMATLPQHCKRRNQASVKSVLFAAEEQQKQQPYALMIDAENASSGPFYLIMEDLEKRGIQTPIRRVFGKAPILLQEPWQIIIREYSLIPIYCQCLTDMELAVDAMDILYTKKSFIQGFVLCSSDSDFTRLVQRIREDNLQVLGVGQRFKTNAEETLAKACNEFVYTEDLEKAKLQASEEKQREKDFKEKPMKKTKLNVEGAERAKGEQEVTAETSQWLDIESIWKSIKRTFETKTGDTSSTSDTASTSSTIGNDEMKVESTFQNGLGRAETGVANEEVQLSASNTIRNEKIKVDSTDQKGSDSSETGVPNEEAQLSLVQILKDDLKALSPNNVWVNLGTLASYSNLTVEDTGYKKMSEFIGAQSDHFEMMKVGSTCRVRLRGKVQQSFDPIVEILKNELKTLSPDNEWVYLSVLTEHSSVSVKDTGYKKMADFIRAESDHFELKLIDTTYYVRLRE